MNFLSTAFQLPVAPAAGTSLAAHLTGAVSVIQPPVAAPPAQHEYKVRQMASHATHRAQVLAQRRTTIPSSAKRW
ncbi:hypothetical protein J0X19_04480 [Hymenobacter sp. BT186]|uniref:Secreted protein n=1 Tax=Hymenobacter telluris TaxID=2816474 RepID=A0A939J7Y3_9BACT|nr:hypothetical protein [Hymenobacter telluris]MBO0357189.1 hypothetical protein [Hymenobacter telluris]MBW3373215.1 hypothetical protein [Hymenobacter norwichensis]